MVDALTDPEKKAPTVVSRRRYLEVRRAANKALDLLENLERATAVRVPFPGYAEAKTDLMLALRKFEWLCPCGQWVSGVHRQHHHVTAGGDGNVHDGTAVKNWVVTRTADLRVKEVLDPEDAALGIR